MPTCLIEFLTSKPGDEEKAKEKQLYDELKGINDYLDKNGPYFGGNNVTTHDLTLAPKLKHTIIATKTIKVRTVWEKDPLSVCRPRPCAEGPCICHFGEFWDSK